MKQKYEKLHTFLDRKYALWLVFGDCIAVALLLTLTGI